MEDVENELNDVDEPEAEDFEAACRRHRLWMTPDQEAAVSLFDFVVNPTSFGQTVENLFYISFLIREGNAKVLADDYGLPLLGKRGLNLKVCRQPTNHGPVPSEPHTVQEQREKHVQKHQAVFSLDWPTWRKLIRAFDIKQPLIPHRVSEETTVLAGGWYGG